MSNDPRLPVLKVIETLADQYLKGKVQAVKLAMMSLLSGGHLLLEDIPGLGKTTRLRWKPTCALPTMIRLCCTTIQPWIAHLLVKRSYATVR